MGIEGVDNPQEAVSMGDDYSKVFERMLRSGGFHNGSQLARAMGITPQAVSNYKRRGGLPIGLLIRFARRFNVSVDWLLTGEGRISRSGGSAAEQKVAGQGEQAGVVELEVRAVVPDDVIYIGKLLKILRGPEGFASRGVKVSIDAFLKAASCSQ